MMDCIVPFLKRFSHNITGCEQSNRLKQISASSNCIEYSSDYNTCYYYQYNSAVMIGIILLLIVCTLAVISFVGFSTNVWAQGEQLIDAGPVQLSTKIDLGVLIAAAAFGFTILYNFKQLRTEMKQRDDQIRNDKKISEVGFWLNFRDQVSRYDDIISYFRAGGKWSFSLLASRGPTTREEWSKVESYMLLLQYLNMMIDQGVLAQEAFDKLYGDMVDAIFYNNIVRTEKLVLEGKSWKEFSRLCIKRNLHLQEKTLAFQNGWPPFWILIAFSKNVTTIGDSQHIGIYVFDSLESLKSDNEQPVTNAFVKLDVYYPSSKKDNFCGSTDEEGFIGFQFFIEEDSLVIEGKQKQNIENKAQIKIEVSKGDKTLTIRKPSRTFKITERS